MLTVEPHDHRHARLHGAGDHPRARRRRSPRRRLRARLRRLLPADRPARVRGRHADEDAHAARADAADAAVAAHRAADPARARRAGAGVPRKGSRTGGRRMPSGCFEMACDCCTSDVWDNAMARATWWESHLSELTGPLTLTDQRARGPSPAGAVSRSRMRNQLRCRDAATATVRIRTKSWLDRPLLSLFTEVRAGEGATAALMLLQHLPAAHLLLDHQDRARAADPARRRRRSALVRRRRTGAGADGVRPALQLVRLARRPRQAAGRRHAVLRHQHRAVRAGGGGARAVRRRRVLHLGRHLQHLADRAVLVVRQRHLHARRPAIGCSRRS